MKFRFTENFPSPRIFPFAVLELLEPNFLFITSRLEAQNIFVVSFEESLVLERKSLEIKQLSANPEHTLHSAGPSIVANDVRWKSISDESRTIHLQSNGMCSIGANGSTREGLHLAATHASTVYLKSLDRVYCPRTPPNCSDQEPIPLVPECFQ